MRITTHDLDVVLQRQRTDPDVVIRHFPLPRIERTAQLRVMPRGCRYQQEGNHAEAIACYDKGLAMNSGNTLIWVNKGSVLLALKRGAEALACFERAISLDPRDFNALNNKGIALMSIGKHLEGMTCIIEAKKLGKG